MNFSSDIKRHASRVFPDVYRLVGAVLCGCCHLLAAAPEAPSGPTVLQLESPAPVHSHLSRLTRDETGAVYLSWVVEKRGLAELAFARLREGVWGEVTTISSGPDWFVNWADFPMLSAAEGDVVAHWLRRSAPGVYDYDVNARFYNASLERWGVARVINTDGVRAEHGFVSMVPLGNRRTLISWLDGRNTKNTPRAGPMTLRAAVFDPTGDRLEEWELDASVCDCCQTSSALTSEGPVVVYRDRTATEVRDIAIVRLVDDVWTQPRLIHGDGWQIAGCPVNGPAVAADGNRVAVAWFSAKEGLPKVQLALSTDSGATFSSPITVAASTSNGRVDTVFLSNGDVVVSWMDDAEATAKIMLSRFSPEAVLVDAVAIAETSPSRRSGFPIIEAREATVYVTWTDIQSARQVRLARVAY